MGTDELFKKRQATAILKRKEGQRGKVRDTVLIVTEGERTEPLYFEGFCLPNVTVVGSGCNCDSLVEFAKSVEIEYKRKRDMIFDKIWCVFDRDSFPLGNFDRAFFWQISMVTKWHIQMKPLNCGICCILIITIASSAECSTVINCRNYWGSGI